MELKTLGGNEKTSISEIEMKAFEHIISTLDIEVRKTLETGFAFGASAIAILNATPTSDAHVAIDPHAMGGFKGLGVENVQEFAREPERLRLICSPSEIALPLLLEAEEKFAFVFIDGHHAFEYAFLDFFYCAQLLEVGGIIVFHDKWMKSIQKVASFIKNNKPDFREIVFTNRKGFENLYVFIKTEQISETPWDKFNAF